MIHIVGHTAIDHLFRVPMLPGKHASTYILDHQVYYGGGAANIAAGIARLGGGATLVSAVGGDFPGSEYDAWMDRLNVQKRLFVVEDSCTPTAYMFTEESGDQMTFFDWGASETFACREAPALEFVHLATADPDFNVRVAEKSEFVSFDPGQDLLTYSHEQLRTILEHTSLLFANRHELAGMCRGLGLEPKELLAPIPTAIITMDAGGSMLYMDGEEHFIPVVPVEMKDPTGAGDAYRAGFLTAYRRGYT
ncbi:MAG TPA: PfkB family carbohydrate kinase, partial [Methanomicrobiales archaeon]|nr:PfkB family carbohydrate kinase [Methanomicrobiales archaeon]